MNVIKQQIKDVFTDLDKLKEDGIWFDGKKDKGEYKRWWKNGQLHIHCFYNDEGKRDSVYKEWYDNGELYKHIIFNDGSPLREIV